MIRNQQSYKFLMVILGGFIFAAGVNLFIVPLDLYSGGIVGIAQIIRSILIQFFHVTIPSNFDIAGIINFMINVPLLVIAFRVISHQFFYKTLCCVIIQTIAFSLIAIPKTPILDDVLANCLIGGVVCGFGIGLSLRNGGSGGGLDILGVYFTKKIKDFSVGKLSIIVNAFVYFLCAILFDIQTAIYSILYMVCFSLIVDHSHYQNINITAMIFTKNKDVQQQIMQQTGRGVTYWDGAGAYTDDKTRILVTAINKYEANQLRSIVMDLDPNAFLIFSEGPEITGGFEKRL